MPDDCRRRPVDWWRRRASQFPAELRLRHSYARMAGYGFQGLHQASHDVRRTHRAAGTGGYGRYPYGRLDNGVTDYSDGAHHLCHASRCAA